MIEEVHRWIATVLIIGVVGLAIGVFRGYRGDRRLTHPMVWVLGLLVLQVVLGGVTVLLKNVSWTVVIHYGAAALLVAALALVAVRLAFPADAGSGAGWVLGGRGLVRGAQLRAPARRLDSREH